MMDLILLNSDTTTLSLLLLSSQRCLYHWLLEHIRVFT